MMTENAAGSFQLSPVHEVHQVHGCPFFFNLMRFGRGPALQSSFFRDSPRNSEFENDIIFLLKS